MPIEMTFDPDIQEALLRLKKSSTTVPEDVAALHLTAKRTRDGLIAAAKKETPNTLISAVSKHPVFDVRVSEASIDRACRVLDALARAIEEAGLQFSGAKISGYGDTLRLRLREKTSQVRNKPKPGASELELMLAPSVVYVPNGTLGLEIGNDFDAWSTRRAVWETKTRPIETLVFRVMFELLTEVQKTRNRRASRAAAERQQQDTARSVAERQERRKRRREREEALFQVADQWRRCETLRGFMEAVRQVTVEEVGSADGDPKIRRWLAWAEKVADRHDPLVRLRKSSPSMRRPT
jgi:hypothetical protein